MKTLNSKGISVVELLIASFISIIVLSAAMGVYLAQHKHMIDQEQISDMQHNVRAGMEELANKIRMSGFQVPEGMEPLTAFNTNPDTICLVYDSDLLEGVDIDHPMPQPSAELRCDDDDLSPLHDGDWVFIYDPFAQVGEYFEISHVQYGSGHIQHNTMPLSRCYPMGSQLIMLNMFKYYVDNATDPDHPCMMIQKIGRPPEIYADNVMDLQFQYVLSSGAVVDVPPMAKMVREVRIGMTARTDREDINETYGYRTRTLNTKVKVRNLAIN